MAPTLTSPDRAKYQQWLYFAASTMDAFQPRIMIIEDIPAGELRTEKEAPLLEEVRDVFSTLDQTLSKNSYLVANKFSAADICVSYGLYWCTLWPEFVAIMEKFPSVTSYLERMKKMPSAVEAQVFSYPG
jgi:glutathione S-transferase